MVVAWLTLRVQPQKRAEILSALDLFVPEMLQAQGCGRGRVLFDLEDPHQFIVVSEWASREDANTFLASSQFQVFRGMRMLLRVQPTVVIDEVRNRVTRLVT